MASGCLKETLSYLLQLNLQDEVVSALYSQVRLIISSRKSRQVSRRFGGLICFRFCRKTRSVGAALYLFLCVNQTSFLCCLHFGLREVPQNILPNFLDRAAVINFSNAARFQYVGSRRSSSVKKLIQLFVLYKARVLTSGKQHQAN